MQSEKAPAELHSSERGTHSTKTASEKIDDEQLDKFSKKYTIQYMDKEARIGDTFVKPILGDEEFILTHFNDGQPVLCVKSDIQHVETQVGQHRPGLDLLHESYRKTGNQVELVTNYFQVQLQSFIEGRNIDAAILCLRRIMVAKAGGTLEDSEHFQEYDQKKSQW